MQLLWLRLPPPLAAPEQIYVPASIYWLNAVAPSRLACSTADITGCCGCGKGNEGGGDLNPQKAKSAVEWPSTSLTVHLSIERVCNYIYLLIIEQLSISTAVVVFIAFIAHVLSASPNIVIDVNNAMRISQTLAIPSLTISKQFVLSDS